MCIRDSGPDGGTAIDGWTVTSCTTYSNGEQGIELYSASNCIVQNCTSYNNGTVQSENGHSIVNAGTTDGTTTRNINNIIRYNLCYGGTTTTILNYYSSGGQVYYNICYDSGLYGISFVDNTVNDVNIYNNVVYNSQNRDGIHVQTIDAATTAYIKNNIIDTVHLTSYCAIRVLADSVDYTVTNYNCAYNIGAGRYVNWGGIAYSLADYITNTGNGVNSITEDPLFEDVSSNNFRLQSSSPCIEAGVDVGLTQDYNGNPIVGTPDIGAFEYQHSYGSGFSRKASNVKASIKTVQLFRKRLWRKYR